MDENKANPSGGNIPRIMIVDDHPNTAAMLARALGQFEMPVEILTARSGQEALDLIGERPVELLITDFMMPGMNGLELVEKLQHGREPGHIILITAYDSPGLAATARHLKVNDYLVKPVQPDRIREIVGRVLKSLQKAHLQVAELPSASHFKLLIADDYPDNVTLLIRNLQSEGYNFVTASDGEETLAKVQSELPDLVLLDVNMPKKTGFEVLAAMRSDEATAHIPVIILTAARVSSRDVREGLGLGADDYITKPFDWRELRARISSKLRIKYAEDALRRRNRELGLLPDIGRDLSARLDVEELARVTLRRSVEALQASSGHIVVFEPDGSAVHHMHSPAGPLPLPDAESQQRLVAEGLIAHVIKNRQGTMVADTTTDPRWLALEGDPSLSAVCVPLLGRRGVLGVLTLTHAERGHFTEDHVSLLQAIASQAAIAVENAQFHALNNKRVNELIVLNQLAREISMCTTSDELFEQVPDLIQAMLGYPVVGLWLTEAGMPRLRTVAGAATAAREAALALAPAEVSTSGEPCRMPQDAAAPPDSEAAAYPSAIAVPLFWEAKISGVLSVHSPRPNAFQESDQVMLDNLAAQLATALERLRLFETIQQEQRRLAAVLGGAADAILVLDRDSSLRLLNPAGRRLFTDIETRIGVPLPRGTGYDDLIDLLEEARGTSASGELAWPDGRTFNAVITPIEEGGEVAVLHDVTRFKELERVKNEFVATASHDLKNPITSMLGYSDLIGKMGPLNEQQTMFLDRVQKAANQMYDLVQDLLELTRIDMGIDLKLEPVSVLDLFMSVTSEFQPQAAQKEQNLSVEPFKGRPNIQADPARLRQVLRNLVGNAVKYTPPGGRIRLAMQPQNGRARITVSDTGFGIPAADLPFIFDKFYRVKSEDTKDIEGTGLGLAIVKSIVEQHGGEVFVESKLGEGTSFGFTVPLAGEAVAPPAAAHLNPA